MFKTDKTITNPFLNIDTKEDLTQYKKTIVITSIVKDFCEKYLVETFDKVDNLYRAKIIMEMIFGYEDTDYNNNTFYMAIIHLLLVKHTLSIERQSMGLDIIMTTCSGLSVLFNMAKNAPNINGVFHRPRRAMNLERMNELGVKFLGGYCEVSMDEYRHKEIEINELIDTLYKYLLEGFPVIYEFGIISPHLFTFEKFSSLYSKQ